MYCYVFLIIRVTTTWSCRNGYCIWGYIYMWPESLVQTSQLFLTMCQTQWHLKTKPFQGTILPWSFSLQTDLQRMMKSTNYCSIFTRSWSSLKLSVSLCLNTDHNSHSTMCGSFFSALSVFISKVQISRVTIDICFAQYLTLLPWWWLWVERGKTKRERERRKKRFELCVWEGNEKYWF